jgi:hypothetical protein
MNRFSGILCELNSMYEVEDTLRVTNPRTVGESDNDRHRLQPSQY